jgi:predicted ArsR family transcriptional regulator
MDTWLGTISEKLRENYLKDVAMRLAGETGGKSPVRKRLIQAVERLNELNYQARWEASAVGPRLILGHCPYSAIVTEHPELCRMDSFLLEKQLGSSVEQVAKLQMSEKGLPFCAFLMAGNN